MQTIIVTVEINVPDTATEQDIKDFVDVEYGYCNSMKNDNPCGRGAAEVISAEWDFDRWPQ